MKEDLRVKKTKIALAQAMVGLLKTQSFKKITVNDLCREAMVSRSAFYVHFEDKYVLLRYCLDGIKEETASEYAGLDAKARILTLLNQIQEHRNIFCNLLVTDLDAEVAEMLWQAVLMDFRASRLPTGSLPEEKEAALEELASVYYVIGVTSVITMWTTEKPELSSQEVAQLLYGLLPPLA